MADLFEYKCPNCGGAIAFDSGIQKLKCPYCDTEFEISALQEYDEHLKNDIPDKMEWNTDAGSEWDKEDFELLNAYVCQSCGGEIISEATTAATSCPFCDNPIVIPSRLSGVLKPDYIIPFKIDKNTAIEALKKHTSAKKLLPKVFKDQNRIEEVKGIYVPFWLFDTDADADIRYKATMVRRWSDRDYNYTETKYYSVLRSGTLGFTCVPVDGSSKIADDLMESIEPFDFSDALDFKTAYLAGYLADKYDIDAESSIDRANERVKQSTISAFASTVTGYNNVLPEHTSIQLQNGTVKYVLYPVWLLNTNWQGKKYTFAMNGQTGKFVGDLPMDKGAFFRWWAGLTAGISAAAYLIMLLLS